MKLSAKLNMSKFVRARDSLTDTTSQKYEVCTWQTLGLQRQTIFCPVNWSYLPSLSCIWFEQRLSDRFMHWHKHPNKTHSSHSLFMYKIKRQTVHLWGEQHFVSRLTEQQHQHQQRVIRKQKPVRQTLWLDAAAVIEAWEKHWFQLCLLPAWSHCGQSNKRLCVLLQTSLAVGGILRCLVGSLCLSHFFSPFPGFSEFFGGRLLQWWENFPGTGREMSTPA